MGKEKTSSKPKSRTTKNAKGQTTTVASNAKQKANQKAQEAYRASKTPAKTTSSGSSGRTVTGVDENGIRTYGNTPISQIEGFMDVSKVPKVDKPYVKPLPSPELENFPDAGFTTGNPVWDKYINEIYIPLVSSQFSNNPAAIFEDAAFKTYKDQVDKTWGPIFEKELSLAQDEYTRSKKDIEAKASYERETLGQQESRTLEDTGIKKQRIARSLDEAKQESAMAMANRGLTFGGTRQKEEGKLTRAATEETSDVQRESQRTLDDITGKKKYYGVEGEGVQSGVGEYGRSLQEKDVALEGEKRRLAGEKTLQYEGELKRLTDLGSSILGNKYLTQ